MASEEKDYLDYLKNIDVDAQTSVIVGKYLTLARDYPSIIDWTIKKIPEWTDLWTDFTITDPGIIFINAGAYVYDLINLQLDENYFRNILRLSQSMESLYYMAELNGLEMQGYELSVGRVQISSTFSSPVYVPAGFVFYLEDKFTNTRYYYVTTERCYVAPGSFGVAKCIEGKPEEVIIYYSELNENQEFIIANPNIGMNTLSAYISYNGSTWTEIPKVEHVMMNTLQQLTFSAHYEDRFIRFIFSPGLRNALGAIGLTDVEIKICFVESHGTLGNVGEKEGFAFSNIIYTSGLSGASMDVTDKFSLKMLGSENGKDPRSLEDVRVYIGDNNWRADTLITTDDFNQLVALYFKDTLVRLAFTQEQGVETLYLYYVPKEGIAADKKAATVTSLTELVKPRLFGGTQLVLSEIGYRAVAVELRVYLSVNISNTTEIEDKIKTFVKEYINREHQVECMTFSRNELLKLIEDNIEEIKSAFFIYPLTDLTAVKSEIFVFGSLTVQYVQANTKVGE